MEKVIVITGPTGVGKTKISLEIAKRLKTEIINGDAYQIYQKMNIGTAKPTNEELNEVRHHFFDFQNPLEEFSVSDYQKAIRNIITKFNQENKVPLIVGGTGLYIDSVIRNYQFLAPKRNDDLKYDHLSNEELHHILEKLDSNASLQIHPNNRKRVLRAIELANTNDFSSRTLKNEFIYDALVIFLNDERSVLYERINKRVDKMVEDGLIDEVKSLYPNGLGKTAKAAIGYKELYSFFDGELTKEEAIDKIKQNSRHYAKRQMTWYRNQENTKIVNINANNLNETVEVIMNLINEHLKEAS